MEGEQRVRRGDNEASRESRETGGRAAGGTWRLLRPLTVVWVEVQETDRRAAGHPRPAVRPRFAVQHHSPPDRLKHLHEGPGREQQANLGAPRPLLPPPSSRSLS